MKLIKFYQSRESSYDFSDLVSIFQLDDRISEIVTIIKSAIDDYQQGREIDNIYSKFDNLIERVKMNLKFMFILFIYLSLLM